MDLPTGTIPTSFAPRPSAAPAPRASSGGLISAFAFLSYGVLGLVVAAAVGLFVYKGILANAQAAKDAALAKAVASIDPTTALSFVRLSDRLSEGEQLLNQHMVLSNLFTDLDTILPSKVWFSSLNINETSQTDPSGASSDVMTLQGTGVAASFNTLAALSDALANDGRIKDAIFSGIQVKNSTVGFTLSATIDPSLITFSSTNLPTANASSGSAATSSGSVVGPSEGSTTSNTP